MSCHRIEHLTRSDLDPGFDSDPFWSVSSTRQVYCLCAAMDSFFLGYNAIASQLSVSSPEHYGLWQQRRANEEGFVLALRSMPAASFQHVDTSQSASELSLAGQFVVRCSGLHMLEQLKWQGEMGVFDVAADITGKRFRFTPHQEGDVVLPPASYADRMFAKDGDVAQFEWKDREDEAWTGVRHPTFCTSGGHLHLLDAACLGRLADDQVYLASHPSDAWGLDWSGQLGDISLRDIDMFWAVLRRWSKLALTAYVELAAEGASQATIIPVQRCSIKRLGRIALQTVGLPSDRLEQILSFLVYDITDERRDPFLQPLIRVGTDVMWSAYCVVQNNFRRNFLKIASRRPSTERAAGRLIGARADPMALAIGKLFENHTFLALCNTKYKRNGIEGDVDILLWKADEPETVALVECKAQLTPDGMWELKDACRYRVEAEKQLDKSISFLRGLSIKELAQRFPGIQWEGVREFRGVVCMLQGLPIDYRRVSGYPVCTMGIVELRLPSSAFRGARSFVQSVERYEWVGRKDLRIVEWVDLTAGGVVFEAARMEWDGRAAVRRSVVRRFHA